MGEVAAQGRDERGRLGESGRSAGPEEDCRLGQDEGRILDEDGIRVPGERGKAVDRHPGRLEGGDIGAVLGEDPIESGRFRAGAQAVDDARRRLADDGPVEIEDPTRHSVQISTLANRTAAASSISTPCLRSLRLTRR